MQTGITVPAPLNMKAQFASDLKAACKSFALTDNASHATGSLPAREQSTVPLNHVGQPMCVGSFRLVVVFAKPVHLIHFQ